MQRVRTNSEWEELRERHVRLSCPTHAYLDNAPGKAFTLLSVQFALSPGMFEVREHVSSTCILYLVSCSRGNTAHCVIDQLISSRSPASGD